MTARMLRRLAPEEVDRLDRNPVDPAALAVAAPIVDAVRAGGLDAAVAAGRRLGDLGDGDPVIHDRAACAAALDALPEDQQALLRRTGARIESFARAQLCTQGELSVRLPGGCVGHEVVPVDAAGCYAPGGRFPLPSSVLMTACTARTAGVREVWVASPRPTPLTLAAAAVADADGLVALGGAQAVALLACGGGPVPRCDLIAGPGNAYVTAAKHLVSAFTGIDMLAGPSELVVVADGAAEPRTVALDLLAQAEHDPAALPILVALGAATAEAVDAALGEALRDLPTRDTAAAALARGFCVVARDLGAAAEICDRIAPEHLQLSVADPAGLRPLLHHYGALFLGRGGCEVLGDYGLGPNHVLPTGGGARRTGGLSVLTFLRVRTYIDLADPALARDALEDAAALADLEGLAAHAAAARIRIR
jgi:phosphoribosyl-ATP pyrophosphohydrolase/phosphoribosyl-AMP cyclohydrolase/histidinol dehydrogenase